MFPNENASESLIMLSQKQSENHKLKEKVHLARHPEPLTISFNLPFSLVCSLWPVFYLMSFLYKSSVVWVKVISPSPRRQNPERFLVVVTNWGAGAGLGVARLDV